MICVLVTLCNRNASVCLEPGLCSLPSRHGERCWAARDTAVPGSAVAQSPCTKHYRAYSVNTTGGYGSNSIVPLVITVLWFSVALYGCIERYIVRQMPRVSIPTRYPSHSPPPPALSTSLLTTVVPERRPDLSRGRAGEVVRRCHYCCQTAGLLYEACFGM